ncbi:MAG TPA: ABC transporter transmembrane domain-containing protein [Fimbriimonadaceae bacterium]|nr:ABC transporter transmembrane domain-containing protein [Fimbriimonadaceae bacterium]
MRKLNIFRRLDPRLAAELKTQRRPIFLGLLCVVLTSLLTAATIPLIERSVSAIQDVGQFREQRLLETQELRQLAARLGVPEEQAREAFAEASQTLPAEDRQRIAARLGVPPSALDEAFEAVRADRSSQRNRPEEALRLLGIYALAIIGLYGVKYWFTRGQIYYLSRASARLASNLRMKLFAKLQRLPISYFNTKRAGAIHSVLTNDVAVYQNSVMIVRDSIDGPVKAVSAFAFIIAIQWQLALVAILFTPFMAFAIQRNARKMKQAQSDVQKDLSNLGAMTHEALQGTRVVKAFSAEERIEHQYAGLVEASFQSQMRAVKRLASLRPLVEFIGAVALATILFICGWLARSGSLQLSHIAALIYALDVINQGFRALGYVNNTYAQVQAAGERIYGEILDVPEHHADDPGARTLSHVNGDVEFRDVSFVYPDGTQALRNVSFRVPAGSSLALVGPSGAGKSTIADLLLRFYDASSGQILFDGVDVRELRVGWLRSQIGVVPQQTFLFAGTIEENIRMGAPTASDQEVEDAARAAHADVFVQAMPERYATELGERGTRLSGGEMQRVAIARALVRRPAVLLLDEATSNLDAVSEKAVQEALDEIMKQRTSIVIAHRLTTAARADRILVLRRGEVVEQGSHRELMERGGAYAAMYGAFTSGVLGDDVG